VSDLPTGVAYYTVPELAAHLRVSTMTVHRAIRAGHLPALRLGTGPKPAVRVPAADAHQWILNQLNTPKETP
jgi:excisionase family DNA binding protein